MSPANNDLAETKIDFGTVDPKLAIPLYHQIYMRISEKIRDGALPTGSKVPSEHDLAKALNVSRITVKRALNDLADAGLVSRRRGRGTIVIANTDLNFHESLSDYVENVARLRKNTNAQILSREKVLASQRVSEKLKITNNAPVEKITHSLSLEDSVLSYVETYIPHGLTDNFSDEDLKTEPILTLLLQSNIVIKRAEQKLLAVNATAKIAKIMNVEEGAALLKIHCVMFDENERPVEDIYAWYHTERYEYQMTLSF